MTPDFQPSTRYSQFTDHKSHSFWLDRPVFVTGCAGLLGSWLTIALVEAGAAVAGLVRDETPFSHLRVSGYQDRIAVVRDGPSSSDLLVEQIVGGDLVYVLEFYTRQCSQYFFSSDHHIEVFFNIFSAY